MGVTPPAPSAEHGHYAVRVRSCWWRGRYHVTCSAMNQRGVVNACALYSSRMCGSNQDINPCFKEVKPVRSQSQPLTFILFISGVGKAAERPGLHAHVFVVKHDITQL